ncbi:hypothetical protein [Nocardioides convexus]|uniref:hypothetical protein n=1 Tax=Nocardioides convexus TaxID=2712224 RepID=UPI0024186A80|nr:hypothetical protein [Nocardioides convexus]
MTWNVRKAVKPASTTPQVTKAAAQKAGLAASPAKQEKASGGETRHLPGGHRPAPGLRRGDRGRARRPVAEPRALLHRRAHRQACWARRRRSRAAPATPSTPAR